MDTSRGVVVQRLLAIAAVVTAALSVVSVGAGARQQSGAIYTCAAVRTHVLLIVCVP